MAEEERKIIRCKKCGTEVYEGSVFCLKCGTRLDEDAVVESEIEPEAESRNTTTEVHSEINKEDNGSNRKPMSKGKKVRIVVLTILCLVVVLVGTCFYLFKSGWLYRNGYENKIYDTFGICLSHHFSEATCTEPATCEICGTTSGDALGHAWEEASCDVPKTCSRCFETEGTVLGHTTRMGKCGRCGELRQDLLKEYLAIIEYLQDGDIYYESALEMADTNSSTAYGVYLAFSSAASFYKSAKSDYQKAYNACGDYPEFSTLKSKTKAFVDSLPVNAPSSEKDSLIKYLDKIQDNGAKYVDLLEYIQKITKEWGAN